MSFATCGQFLRPPPRQTGLIWLHRSESDEGGIDAKPQPAASPGAQCPLRAPALLCPPEILGDIFEKSLDYPAYISTTSKQNFNFLFVCRWWYQVAVGATRLWTSLDGNVKSWLTFLIRSRSTNFVTTHTHTSQPGSNSALKLYISLRVGVPWDLFCVFYSLYVTRTYLPDYHP